MAASGFLKTRDDCEAAEVATAWLEPKLRAAGFYLPSFADWIVTDAIHAALLALNFERTIGIEEFYDDAA